MKILHFAPAPHHNGASQLAADLPYALQVCDEVESLQLTSAEGQIMTGSKLRYFRFRPYMLPGALGSVLKLSNFISAHRPHILQAYGYEAIAIASRACKRLAPGIRPRLVGAITGYHPGGESPHPSELAGCDALTVVSETLAAPVQAAARAGSVHTIPYGVNDTLCYPQYTPSAEKKQLWHSLHPKFRGRFVICLPGPISAQHGTLNLVPLMTILRQQEVPVHTIIAADSAAADESYMATLRRRIHSADLDADITWAGPVKDLRDVLSLSNAVVSLTAEPAAYDRPILEALALGKPVAGFNHGAVGEYLQLMNPLGALPPGDADAVADVLSQWYNTPPEDLITEVPPPYRLSDTAESYYSLYQDLL